MTPVQMPYNKLRAYALRTAFVAAKRRGARSFSFDGRELDMQFAYLSLLFLARHLADVGLVDGLWVPRDFSRGA